MFIGMLTKLHTKMVRQLPVILVLLSRLAKPIHNVKLFCVFSSDMCRTEGGRDVRLRGMYEGLSSALLGVSVPARYLYKSMAF